MLLLNARDLLAQAFFDPTDRILRRSVGGAVVYGVYREEKILAAEVVVKPRGAKIFADVLLGMAERLRDSARLSLRQQLRPIGNRPQFQQRRGRGVDPDVLFF